MSITAKDLVEINIPRGFKVDGKGFKYFLDRNDVAYLAQTNEEFTTFRFLSMAAGEKAAVMWECLTGSKILGKLQPWKTWKEYTT